MNSSSAVLVTNTKEKDNSENLIPDNSHNIPLQNTDKLPCQLDCKPVAHTVSDRQALASLQLNSEKHGNECLNNSGPFKVAPEHKEPTATIVNQITREAVTSDSAPQNEPQDKSSGSEDPSLVRTQELSSEGTWESCADRLPSSSQSPSNKEPTTPQHSGSDKFDTAEDLSTSSYTFDDLSSSKEVSFTLPLELPETKSATDRSDPTSPPKTYSVQSLTHLITTVLENNPEICSQKFPEATCDLQTKTHTEVVVSEHNSSPAVPKKAFVHPKLLEVQSGACNLSDSFSDLIDQFSNLKVQDTTVNDIKSESESDCDLVEICPDNTDCCVGVEDTTATDLKSETESGCDLVEICPGSFDCNVGGIGNSVKDSKLNSETELLADLTTQQDCVAKSDPPTSFLRSDKSHLENSTYIQTTAEANGSDQSYVVIDGPPQDPLEATINAALGLEVEFQASAYPLCDLQNDEIISGPTTEPVVSEHFTNDPSSLADVSNSSGTEQALATLAETTPSSHSHSKPESFDNQCISEQSLNQVLSCAEGSEQNLNQVSSCAEGSEQNLNQVSSCAQGSEQSLNQVSSCAQGSEQSLNQVSSCAQGSEQSLNQVSSCAEGSEQNLNQVSSCAEGFEQSLNQVSSCAEGSEQSLNQVSSCAEGSEQSLNQVSSCAEGSEQNLNQVSSCAEGSEQSLNQVSSCAEGSDNDHNTSLTANESSDYCQSAVEVKESVAVDLKPVTEPSAKSDSQIESFTNKQDFRVDSPVVTRDNQILDSLQKSAESSIYDQQCSNQVSGQDDSLNSNQTCTESVSGSIKPADVLVFGLGFESNAGTSEPLKPEKSLASNSYPTNTDSTCLGTVEEVTTEAAQTKVVLQDSKANHTQFSGEDSICLETVKQVTTEEAPNTVVLQESKDSQSATQLSGEDSTCLETVKQVTTEEAPSKVVFQDSKESQSATQPFDKNSICLESDGQVTKEKASTEVVLQESKSNQSATRHSGEVLTSVCPGENTSEKPIAKEPVLGNTLSQFIEPPFSTESLTKDSPTELTEDCSPVDSLADFPVIDTTELEQLVQVPHNLNLSFEAMPVQMMEPQLDHQWHADDQMNTIPLGSDNNCAVDINVNPCRLVQGNIFHDNEETLKTAHVNSTTLLDCNVMSSPNKRKNDEDSAFEDLANVEDSNSDLVDDHIMDDNVDEIGVAAVSRRSPSQTRIKVPVPTNKSEARTAPTEQPAVNHSEAGPEVAEFTEEEFRTAAEVFKDPSTFEFLERVSNTKAFEESSLSRLSLYVKFDPLVSKRSQEIRRQSTFKKPVAPQKKGVPGDQEPATGIEQLISIASDCPSSPPVVKRELDANKLIDFHSPNPPSSVAKASPKMVPVEPVQRIENMSCKLFTEDDMKKALQINDLLFQERLIKKDKEIAEAERKSQSQADEIQNQVSILQQSLTFTRSMLEESAQMMRRWQEKKELERVETTRERDQALEDMRNVEASFSELHRRYEKIKAVLQGYKQNEEGLRVQLLDTQDKLRNQEQMYEALKQLSQDKLESANLEIENAKKAGGSEIAVLRSQLMKAEMKISSLEKSLENKAQEFAQLTDIYDDLVARVSGGQ